MQLRGLGAADSGRTGEAGCCAVDVEGSIGAAQAAACLPHSVVGCTLCVPRAFGTAECIGREGTAALASRLVRLLGLVEALSRATVTRISLRRDDRGGGCGGSGRFECTLSRLSITLRGRLPA